MTSWAPERRTAIPVWREPKGRAQKYSDRIVKIYIRRAPGSDPETREAAARALAEVEKSMPGATLCCEDPREIEENARSLFEQ